MIVDLEVEKDVDSSKCIGIVSGHSQLRPAHGVSASLVFLGVECLDHDLAKALGGRQSRSHGKREIKAGKRAKVESTAQKISRSGTWFVIWYRAIDRSFGGGIAAKNSRSACGCIFVTWESVELVRAFLEPPNALDWVI